MNDVSTDAQQRIEPEVFLAQYRNWHDKRRTAGEAKADERAQLELASAAGINLPAFKAVAKLQKMEKGEAQRCLHDILLYLKWLGNDILEHRDLFDNSAQIGLTAGVMAVHRVWEAGQKGYTDGKAGHPLDNNPYVPGSEEHQSYVREWYDGTTDKDRNAKPKGNGEAPQSDPKEPDPGPIPA